MRKGGIDVVKFNRLVEGKSLAWLTDRSDGEVLGRGS